MRILVRGASIDGVGAAWLARTWPRGQCPAASCIDNAAAPRKRTAGRQVQTPRLPSRTSTKPVTASAAWASTTGLFNGSIFTWYLSAR